AQDLSLSYCIAEDSGPSLRSPRARGHGPRAVAAEGACVGIGLVRRAARARQARMAEPGRAAARGLADARDRALRGGRRRPPRRSATALRGRGVASLSAMYG